MKGRPIDELPRDESFPWGDLNPEGGYKVGDIVGIIYSDHEHYIFDNPTGRVTFVEQLEDEPDVQLVTVEVDASVFADKLFLIRRAES